MCRPIMITCLICLFPVMGVAQMPKEMLQKQSEMLRKEAEEGARLYAKLFQAGEDAKLYVDLGNEYMDRSKPVQAILYFKHALQLDKELASAKEGLVNAEASMKSKEAKIEELLNKEEVENKYIFACRRAAIFFHLGYQGDALDILRDAHSRYGKKEDIVGLTSTFKQGIGMERAIMKKALYDFDQSVKNGKLEAALQHFGELMFFNLGSNPYNGVVEKLLETFPSKLDGKKIAAVLAIGEV